jgi:hypothetical protein
VGDDIKVFVLIDDYPASHKQHPLIVTAEDEVSRQAGYHSSNPHIQGKNPTAWDKVLYHLNHVNNQVQFAWILEDDVFVPSIRCLLSLVNKYRSYDLVVNSHGENKDSATTLDWHWNKVAGILPVPWYGSMVCAMGLSRKLLDQVKQFVQEKSRLAFIEIMFNTLAAQAGLSVLGCPELQNIVYERNWSFIDIVQHPDRLYHPVKNYDGHAMLRNLLGQAHENMLLKAGTTKQYS